METKFKMYYTIDEIWWNRGDERKPTIDVINDINWVPIDTFTVSWINETHISLILPKRLNKITFICVREIDTYNDNDRVIQTNYYFPIETQNITIKNSEVIFELDLWCSIILPYCQNIEFYNSVIGDTYSPKLYDEISKFDKIPLLLTPINFKEYSNGFFKTPTPPIVEKMLKYMNDPSFVGYNLQEIYNCPPAISSKLAQRDISDYYDVYTCGIDTYKNGRFELLGTVILPRKVNIKTGIQIKFEPLKQTVYFNNTELGLNHIISNIGKFKDKEVLFMHHIKENIIVNYIGKEGKIKLGEYKGTWKLPYVMLFKDKYKIFIKLNSNFLEGSDGYLGFFIPDDGMELISLDEYYDKNHLITSYMSGWNFFLDENSWVFFNTKQKLKLFFNEEPYIVGEKFMFPLQSQVPISIDEYKKYVSINQKYLETGYDNQRRNILFNGLGNVLNVFSGLFPSNKSVEKTMSSQGSREVLTPGGFSSTQNFFNDQGKVAEKIFTSAPHNKISLSNNKTSSSLTKYSSSFNGVGFGLNTGLSIMRMGLQLYNLKQQKEAMYDQLNKSLNFSKFGSTQWYQNMSTAPVLDSSYYYSTIPMYKYNGYGAKLASTQGIFNISKINEKITLKSPFNGKSETFYVKPFEQERDIFEKVLYKHFNKYLADIAIDMLFQGIKLMKKQIQDSSLYSLKIPVPFVKESVKEVNNVSDTKRK